MIIQIICHQREITYYINLNRSTTFEFATTLCFLSKKSNGYLPFFKKRTITHKN